MDNNLKEIIRKKIKEMSTTGGTASFTPGTGANYATPAAFNPNKNAKGAQNIYYYKLGFKPVDTKTLHKKAKGIDVKQLWEEEEQPSFDIEAYISTLPTDNEEIKKYIAGRLGDYNNLSDKLKELIQLISDAKKETINTYRENPQFKAIYGTDLAASLLDDVIELFKK
jgi:hypothetical protein